MGLYILNFWEFNLKRLTGEVPYGIFKVYSGRIDGLTLTDTSGISMMEISVANHWADFERISGRQTNNSSQKHHFANDLSMEFAPQTGKKLVWGDITSEEAEKL